ncbi:MAG TPA: alpha/beta hydrolase [Thermoanaerobaculia bacterium]|nr:alpha/beta hydrolase [Thermoanaerobaculia bacterium]
MISFSASLIVAFVIMVGDPPAESRTAATMVAEIRRADYEGDRAALRRLHAELASLVGDDDSSSRILYWRGFALWRSALNGFNDAADPTEIDADLEQAATDFREAIVRDPGFVDAMAGAVSVLVNRSFLLRQRNASLARTLWEESGTLLEAARTAGPENPRQLWVLGANQWYAPAERGGGQNVAVATYEKGLQLARKETGAGPLNPAWGEPELLMNLAFAKLNHATPDLDAAECHARSALALVPYWHYVGDILLPQILEAKKKQKDRREASEARPHLSDGEHLVEIDGRPVRVQVARLREREPGSPIVVFEAGATQSLDAWKEILPRMTPRTPALAYDRAGLGSSAWDETSPTPRHVWLRLSTLLRQVGAEPPYLFVGHSWGGMLVRYFSGFEPSAVAGLVLVDPGPILTQTLEERLAPFHAIGTDQASYEAHWKTFEDLFRNIRSSARAEFDVYRKLLDTDPEERDLEPMPAVPLMILVAARYEPLPLQLPFDQKRHFEADLRHRVRLLQEWALSSPRGTLVVTQTSGHRMMKDDPDLVVWAITRALDEIAYHRETQQRQRNDSQTEEKPR